MKSASVWFIAAAGLSISMGGCDSDVTEGPGTGGAGAMASSSSGGGQGGACATDADCLAGSAWCVGGACVPCDNSGPACDIACVEGWTPYERNGCLPCACAPINDCVTDEGCPGPVEGPPVQCYAGNFCWDWCPAGDPSCCLGNVCSLAGCSAPVPTGCLTTGCPEDEQCVVDPATCASSGCSCDGASWLCTPDCGGGACVPAN